MEGGSGRVLLDLYGVYIESSGSSISLLDDNVGIGRWEATAVDVTTMASPASRHYRLAAYTGAIYFIDTIGGVGSHDISKCSGRTAT